MNSSDTTSAQSKRDISPDNLPPEFTRAVTKARAAILWERLWPRVVPPAAISGLFLSASFAGVWGMASPTGRMTGLAAFALAFAASVIRPPKSFKTDTLNVTRDDALRRLDKNINDARRTPAQTIGSHVADGSSDADKAAWNLHISNTWREFAGQFRAGIPHPGMNERDPKRLRFLIALTLAVTAATSQAPHIEQVKQAFDWTVPVPQPPPEPPLQLKAWIKVPEGIDAPELQMTEATRDETQGGEKMSAHETSVLTIMTYDRPARIEVNGKVLPLQKEIPQGEGKTGYQYEVTLEVGDNKVAIERGPRWHIPVVADKPPTVSIKGILPPKDKNSRSIDIDYQAQDDNGYTGEITIDTPKDVDPKAQPLPSAKIPVLGL